jgi:hypothetical protein
MSLADSLNTSSPGSLLQGYVANDLCMYLQLAECTNKIDAT